MIQVHPENSAKFTPAAQEITQKLNDFKRQYGWVSFKDMAKIFNLEEKNCRRYYYGFHDFMEGTISYQQMRKGACVSINPN